jgi:hypothetical protein
LGSHRPEAFRLIPRAHVIVGRKHFARQRLSPSTIRRELAALSSLCWQCQISRRIPHVDLTDVLLEVAQRVSFGRHLTPAGGGQLRTDDLLPHLYAVLMAQGSNMGLIQMAHSVNLTHARLAWRSTWYLREETLKAAVAALVNF